MEESKRTRASPPRANDADYGRVRHAWQVRMELHLVENAGTNQGFMSDLCLSTALRVLALSESSSSDFASQDNQPATAVDANKIKVRDLFARSRLHERCPVHPCALWSRVGHHTSLMDTPQRQLKILGPKPPKSHTLISRRVDRHSNKWRRRMGETSELTKQQHQKAFCVNQATGYVEKHVTNERPVSRTWSGNIGRYATDDCPAALWPCAATWTLPQHLNFDTGTGGRRLTSRRKWNHWIATKDRRQNSICDKEWMKSGETHKRHKKHIFFVCMPAACEGVGPF